MLSIKWLVLLLIAWTNSSYAKEVKVEIDSEKTLRPLWIPPNYPKIVVMPGDIARCLNQSKFVGSISADSIDIGETKDKWVREVAVFLRSSAVGGDLKLAEFAIGNEVGIPCKFEVSEGKYQWKTLLIRADVNNRFKNEESYVLHPKNYEYMTSRLERRIKNYRSVKIRDGQVVIEFKDPSLEEAISKKTSKHAEERSIKKYRLLKVKPGGGVIE